MENTASSNARPAAWHRFGQPLRTLLGRLGHWWWQGAQRQARERCRDETEALEQLRDRWRR
ncbi:hypothetical protein QU481_20395 [Crenobacter sp. SG2303]|uniref:Uncharacterized protein n=1 Tax=Crenobacter oryzisoli TaxID=3056844 RepID=A0ABT7XTS7_9NEIS|nr:hypothetical protein [Crenobacter sp. SG2303]MDN0077205.1 hypothetical protein [Crenobacter sp. SG2303]